MIHLQRRLKKLKQLFSNYFKFFLEIYIYAVNTSLAQIMYEDEKFFCI